MKSIFLGTLDSAAPHLFQKVVLLVSGTTFFPSKVPRKLIPRNKKKMLVHFSSILAKKIFEIIQLNCRSCKIIKIFSL